MYTNIIRPILFALSQGDAEEAHLLVKRVAKGLQRMPPLLSLIEFLCDVRRNPNPVTRWGITFPNRIGLAAGLDKNAEMILFLQALGFGFLEIGSVLPRFQEGNPRPRMFRLESEESIINRMGFNSAGMSAVVANLARYGSSLRIPLGISLGKMKDTPLEKASEDSIAVLKWLYPWADFCVLNISSPNTPGLRELQGGRYLEALVRQVVGASQELGGKPILVKIAPDLTCEEVGEVLELSKAGGASGLIISNTTMSRPFGPNKPKHGGEIGGLSGPLVFPLMLEKVQQIRKLDHRFPIIAVGGIHSIDYGQRALDEGADLIQILTGLIYEGPSLVRKLRLI